MKLLSAKPEAPSPHTRWGLIRDVLVFQIKLAADALRDLLLSPVSLAAALFDLVTGGEKPGRSFYGLLALGRRSERFIDLFGADAPHSKASLDALVDNVERLLVGEVERGGVTASAKDAIDRSLDAIARERKRSDRRR